MSRRLLIVSSVRWEYLWQRHQSLAVAAAEDGWQVDFLKPHPRNLRQLVVSPLRRIRGEQLTQEHPPPPAGVRVLPLKAWLSPRTLGPYDLALVYVPDRITEWFLREARAHRVIYDAVLDWASVPPHWFPPIGWRRSERRLAALPGAAVTTDAPGMAEILAGRGITAGIVPPAADEPFLAAKPCPFEQREARALYFGSVRDEVDLDALARLRRDGIGVDIIGRAEDPALETELGAHGIVIRPPVPVQTIAAIASRYRVVLLPYRGERARSLSPAKTWNCIATGAWVVAKGLTMPGEPTIIATASEDEFAAAVTRAMAAPPPPPEAIPTWRDRWRQLLTTSETGTG